MLDDRFAHDVDDPTPIPPGEMIGARSPGLKSLARFVRAVRVRIATLAVCLAGAWSLGLVYYGATPRVYEAEAEVMIGSADRDDRVLISEVVLQEAARKLVGQRPASFAGVPDRDRAALLRSRLTVRKIGGRTNVLHVTCGSSDPREAADSLDEVVTAFVDYVKVQERVKRIGREGTEGLSARKMLSFLLEKKAAFDKEIARQQADLFVELRRLEDGTDEESPIRQADGIRERDDDRRLAEMKIALHNLQQTRAFSEIVEKLADGVESKIDDDSKIEVIQRPTVPSVPASPRRLSHVWLVTTILGTGLGLGLVFVLEVFDDRFRSAADLRRALGAPVLGVLRRRAKSGSGDRPGLGTVEVCEELQSLRIGLEFSSPGAKQIVLASVDRGDGTTTVAAGLAKSFAHSGRRTLLIDADFKRRGLSAQLGPDDRDGLAGLLTGRGPLGEGLVANVVSLHAGGPDLLPAGSLSGNPAALFASDRFTELLARMGRHYERIVIDAPPLTEAVDGAIIGRQSDGVIVVVRPDTNRRRRALLGLESLHKFGCRPIGVVVNQLSKRSHWDPRGGVGPAPPSAAERFDATRESGPFIAAVVPRESDETVTASDPGRPMRRNAA